MSEKIKVRHLIALALLTAFFGEVKIYPFGDEFRFALGPVVYLLGLIMFVELPLLLTGGFVALITVLFRILINITYTSDVGFMLDEIGRLFLNHFPAGLYYLCLAAFLEYTGARDYRENPWILGLLLFLGDFLSNLVELIIRTGRFEPANIFGTDILLLVITGLRASLVVGLFSVISLQQVRIAQQQERLRFEKLLIIASGLYEEAFYLKKSMHHIEGVTAKSFLLYKKLKALDNNDVKFLSGEALELAEEVHEIKKDSQRILAGLAKLLKNEDLDERLTFSELTTLVINANENYAQILEKDIEIISDSRIDFATPHVYILLSILNNLVANAIEAIEKEGRIIIYTRQKGEHLKISISDTGVGISEKDMPLLFSPGFTTKFDQKGVASTGIGLIHAKDLVESLGGNIGIESEWLKGTKVKVEIPLNQLKEGE